jgi:hypothetical protein
MSLIYDKGTHPHRQTPHADFHYYELNEHYIKKNQNEQQLPLSLIYAINDFTILLYPEDMGTLGGNIAIRLIIPKGKALLFTANMFHCGDMYDRSNDEYSTSFFNDRIFCYCIPNSLRDTHYRVGHVLRGNYRKDITSLRHDDMAFITFHFPNESKDFQAIVRRACDVRSIPTDQVKMDRFLHVLYLCQTYIGLYQKCSNLHKEKFEVIHGYHALASEHVMRLIDTKTEPLIEITEVKQGDENLWQE